MTASSEKIMPGINIIRDDRMAEPDEPNGAQKCKNIPGFSGRG